VHAQVQVVRHRAQVGVERVANAIAPVMLS